MGGAIGLLLMLLLSGAYAPPAGKTHLTKMEALHVAYRASQDIDWSIQAVAVSVCESGDRRAGVWANTEAVGDHGTSHGAWQVQPRYWGPVSESPYVQARQAYRIWREHGWQPWACGRRL